MKFAHWVLRIAILSGILIGGFDQATAETIYLTAQQGNQIIDTIGLLAENQEKLQKFIEMVADDRTELQQQILTLQEDVTELQLHAISVLQLRDMAKEIPSRSTEIDL